MKTRFLLFALVATIIGVSCNRNDSQAPFAFAVSAESVREGNPVPVSVAISRGGVDGYSFLSTIEKLDLQTSMRTPTGYILMDGGNPANGSNVSFVDNGKRDFYIDGVVAGTYVVTVELGRDGAVVKSSAVFVVTSSGGGVDPVERKDVEFVALSGLELVDGALALTVGQERRYQISWKPEDATAPVFSVSSSDGGVVETALVGNYVVIRAVGTGEADVIVREVAGAKVTVPVRVKPEDVPVSEIAIDGLELTDGRLLLEDGNNASFALSWGPVEANLLDFTVVSSNPEVASGVVEDGRLIIHSLYPGDTVLSISTTDGPTVRIPVRVEKHVVVTVSWRELQATEAQLRTKTFPCYLVFSSDSNKAFPTPVTWSVTMKGVVNVTGEDTQSVTSKQDVKFFGNNEASYDVCTNVLIPCYSIYRTSSFTLSLTLSLQRDDSLDSRYWKVSFVDVFKSQGARIMDYITEIQQ